MANATMGFARKVGIGAAGSASTQQLEFVSVGGGLSTQHLDSEGIRSYRGRNASSVVEGLKPVDLSMTLEPRPDELAAILKYILGGTPSGTSFPLAETLPKFVLDVDYGQDVMRYDNCKMNRATFRSSSGQKLQLELDIAGTTEAGSTTFPSIGSTLTTMQPYIHHQLVATINSTAYKLNNWELTIDNALVRDRFYNQQARVDLPEGDRIITISADFPHTTDESALYGITVAGVAATWVFTNSTVSVTFTTPKVTAPASPVTIQNRQGEVVRRINFNARKPDDSTAELSVTNDSTP